MFCIPCTILLQASVPLSGLRRFLWLSSPEPEQRHLISQKRYVLRIYPFGSICVPGSYVSKSSSRAPNNAFPRRLTLGTNSKKPKDHGKLSCETPRCGRSHDRSRDQKPSMVLTCTA